MRRTLVFPSPHGLQTTESPESAEQEDPLAFSSIADVSSRETWKGAAGLSSLDRGLRGALFPPEDILREDSVLSPVKKWDIAAISLLAAGMCVCYADTKI